MRKTIAFVFALMLAAGVFAQQVAKKAAPVKATHFLTYDLDKEDFIPYDNDKDIRVFAVGPDGIEPAVVIAESNDGTSVLVGAASIATKMLGKDSPTDPLANNPDTKRTEK